MDFKRNVSLLNIKFKYCQDQINMEIKIITLYKTISICTQIY